MPAPTHSREARVHTQASNRANAALAKGKSKAADDRRVVYKPVLENPYQIKPPTPLNVQNSLLACLADLLPEVAEYHIARETASRKRKSGKRAAQHKVKKQLDEQSKQTGVQTTNPKKRRRDEDSNSESKRAKVDLEETSKQTSTSPWSSSSQRQNNASPTPPKESSLPRPHQNDDALTNLKNPTLEPKPREMVATNIVVPPILKHCVFGINQVTKRLEAQVKPNALGDTFASSCPKSRLRFVIACRTDIDPPLLIEHLPILVAACNSAIPAGSGDQMFVKLATLPMGGEHLLAETIGLRRIAVMALDAETPGLERLESLLTSVTVLRASWLAPPSDISQEPKNIVPTHIKQLKTSAPKDMKAAREKRKREVGEAKEATKADDGRRKRRKTQSEAKERGSLGDIGS